VNRLIDWNTTASFGTTGDALDNAAMETSRDTAKREMEFLHGPYKEFTRSHMRKIIIGDVRVFYYRSRHQAGLGLYTPFESYAAAKAA
jgi:formate-dependent nitrite reductase cytochrome c552 subunit